MIISVIMIKNITNRVHKMLLQQFDTFKYFQNKIMETSTLPSLKLEHYILLFSLALL